MLSFLCSPTSKTKWYVSHVLPSSYYYWRKSIDTYHFFLLVAKIIWHLPCTFTLEIVWLIASIHVIYCVAHSKSSPSSALSYFFAWTSDHEDHVGFLVTGKVFPSTTKGKYCDPLPIVCVDASLVWNFGLDRETGHRTNGCRKTGAKIASFSVRRLTATRWSESSKKGGSPMLVCSVPALLIHISILKSLSGNRTHTTTNQTKWRRSRFFG